MYPGVASGFGIEIDRIKCDKAAAFLRHSVKELKRRAAIEELLVPRIQCSSIEKVSCYNKQYSGEDHTVRWVTSFLLAHRSCQVISADRSLLLLCSFFEVMKLSDNALEDVSRSNLEMQVATLEPATHAYSFWEGVPTEGKCAFGRLFAQSHTMQVRVRAQPPLMLRGYPEISCFNRGTSRPELILETMDLHVSGCRTIQEVDTGDVYKC